MFVYVSDLWFSLTQACVNTCALFLCASDNMVGSYFYFFSVGYVDHD